MVRRRWWLAGVVVAWPVFVAWIIERHFTFGDAWFLATSVAMAVVPGLLLSAYVVVRPHRHLVWARLVAIACGIPAAVATSRRTTEHSCQIDAMCGFEYATVPMVEYVVYGAVVALHTSDVVRRIRSWAGSRNVEDRGG